MKKPAPRRYKLTPRPFGEVATEFLAYHEVPDAFTFKVRNRTLKRAQDPRTQAPFPAINRSAAPALDDDATAQDVVRAFRAFLSAGDWTDELGIRLVRVKGSGKAAGPKNVNGHTKLSTLRERVEAMDAEVDDADLGAFASMAVAELRQHYTDPTDLSVAKALVKELSALVGKRSMSRLVQAL